MIIFGGSIVAPMMPSTKLFQYLAHAKPCIRGAVELWVRSIQSPGCNSTQGPPSRHDPTADNQPLEASCTPKPMKSQEGALVDLTRTSSRLQLELAAGNFQLSRKAPEIELEPSLKVAAFGIHWVFPLRTSAAHAALVSERTVSQTWIQVNSAPCGCCP